ncbi:MAG: DUF4232 domain-containing protein [Frankiaceae bacterium]
MSTARTWRRGTLAAAVAGASVLAATAVAGATTGSASTSATTTAYAKCATANLRVWRPGTNDHAAGSAYWELELSNVSSTTCTLSGFPGVSAVDGNGHQLGSAAGRDHRFAPATVVLRPGTTAHALLRITDVGVFSTATCQPVTATGLRVYPPGTTKAAFVPLRFRACSQQGTVYLFVRTVRARAGIPGYGQ